MSVLLIQLKLEEVDLKSRTLISHLVVFRMSFRLNQRKPLIKRPLRYLKPVFIFSLGFALGILIADFMTPTRNKTSPEIISERVTTEKPKLANQTDKVLTANELYSKPLDLFNEIKILCMIMTNPNNHKTRAVHVKNTWGKRCNKLIFLTSAPDSELDTLILPVQEMKIALRNKTKQSFTYAHDNYLNDFDWFMKADDDR